MTDWVETVPADPRRRAGEDDDGTPSWRTTLRSVLLQEDLNFLVTNRIPRRFATLAMGRLSRIESPFLTRLSIAVLGFFADDLRLDESKTTDFRCFQDCFTRELREGARPIDPDPAVLVSPCDAVVGTFGRVEGTRLYQAKGFPYTLDDLFSDPDLVERHRDGLYVTLRLKANMYHRFHSPEAARVERVRYLSGDTWNVNPIALERVQKLFCKNERAVIELRTDRTGDAVTLVPVASILVGSVRVHAARRTFDLEYGGPASIDCGGTRVNRGEELGYFQSGSTIVLFVSGPYDFAPAVRTDTTIRVGQPLFRRRAATTRQTTRASS